MSLSFYCKEEENSREESINRYKNIFANYDKNTPSLSDALIQMYNSLDLGNKKINELTEDIINKCKATIDFNYDMIKIKYENITKEDAYIICSYTCESEDREYSPYRILNQNLVSNNRHKGVNNISKYLYIFLKSLRKLPRYYPEKKALYRCLNCQVNLATYNIGNKKTFWGFTSTSPDPNATYSFLKDTIKDKEALKTGTVFTLSGDIWGYNIELFNCYQEEEILLEPERKFKITDVLPPLNGITSIRCKILKTDLILSDNKLDSNLISDDEIENENRDNINIKEYIIKFEMQAKINEEKYTKGIGILCKCNIESKKTKKIKALITYNHMINFDFLNKGEKMILYINKKEYEINIKINRYKYTNEDLDFTIIEILDKDNIKNFIEIDNFIYSKNYTGNNIISVYLNDDGDDFELSHNKIIKKDNDYYTCDTETMKEGIIIFKDNMKLIGIIKVKEEKINIIPMNMIIDKINFIKCIYEIQKEDVNKNIQIINNNFYQTIINEEIQKYIKIIINGEIYSNILTFKFNKEGYYTIYLLSYNDLTSMSLMFRNCTSLKELDFSSFNTDQVTNMSYMFYNCSSLKELDLSPFKTNQVTDMSNMFYECLSLKELNLSSFDTSQVKNMSCMFSYCSSLTELNLSSFNTSQVINMSCMFNDCIALTELNLSSFDTSQVIDMSAMFNNCIALEKLDLSSFKTNKVKNMIGMFDKIKKECKIKCNNEKIIKQYKNTKNCIII